MANLTNKVSSKFLQLDDKYIYPPQTKMGLVKEDFGVYVAHYEKVVLP